MTYRLQLKPRGAGPWLDFDCAPAETEQAAWDKLAAWERYCPADRWRWVRTIPAAPALPVPAQPVEA